MAETKLGCSHYRRNCQIEAPCCKEYYWCRFCHNEAIKKCKTEEMDRHAVKHVKCMLCNHTQPVKSSCENCKILFARYFCSICNLFDDTPDKDIYHCEACGICRIGKRDEFVHCRTCSACMPVNHKCTALGFRQNCPVCLEFLFTSREGAVILECGHTIHHNCYNQLLSNHIYKCPLCSKSIVEIDNDIIDEEIRNTPMPAEYRNIKVRILCNDCHAKTKTNFHVLGLKCGSCLGYNTSRIMEEPSAETNTAEEE